MSSACWQNPIKCYKDNKFLSIANYKLIFKRATDFLILYKLHPEGFETVKFDLSPDFPDKVHFDVKPVNHLVEIQYVGLYQLTDVGHPEKASAKRFHYREVHPVPGNEFQRFVELHIGRRETDGPPELLPSMEELNELQKKQYSAASRWFDKAVEQTGEDVRESKYAAFYKAFYYMNRAVLKAEMIDFIASIQTNVQTLAMDDSGSMRARVSDRTTHSYDYAEAIEDMRRAIEIAEDIPYLYFNLGNLCCLSSQLVDSIDNYDKALALYPYMGDAYFNRGLVLIYLKDKEKGCIDLSRAGELGVSDAYGVISKYCEEEENL